LFKDAVKEWLFGNRLGEYLMAVARPEAPREGEPKTPLTS
jgi:hypothetical protein